MIGFGADVGSFLRLLFNVDLGFQDLNIPSAVDLHILASYAEKLRSGTFEIINGNAESLEQELVDVLSSF